MWKKALWIYVILFFVGLIGFFIYDAVETIGEGTFTPSSFIGLVVFLFPVGVLGWAVRKGRANILLIILSLLIAAVPVVGMFKFDGFTLATIGKSLLFVPLIVGLVYYGYRRIFVKS